MLHIRPTLQHLLSEQKSSVVHFAAIYDEITLKCAETSGFKAVAYQSFNHLMPLYTTNSCSMVEQSELILRQMEKLCSQTNTPILCLNDPGLQGYDLNIFISRMENIGVGGLTLFDQHPWPTNDINSSILDEHKMLDRVKRILDQRKQATLVVAGTHISHQQPGSLQQKIERLQLLAETGVDMILVQYPQSVEELRLFASQIPLPCFALMPSLAESFPYHFRMLHEIGYAAVCCVNIPFLHMIHILQETYEALYNQEIPLVESQVIELSQDIITGLAKTPATNEQIYARQQWIANLLKKKP